MRLLKSISKTILVPGGLGLLVGLSGCAPILRAATQSETSQALSLQTEAVRVLEAYGRDGELFVKFESYFKEPASARIMYGHAEWKSEGPAFGESRTGYLPMEWIEEEIWTERPDDLVPVFYDIAPGWGGLRDFLAARVTPNRQDQAVLIPYADEKYVLYYGSDKQLKMVPATEKPAFVEIRKTYTSEELNRLMLQGFQVVFPEQARLNSPVLLSMMPEAGQPLFMYINPAENLVLNFTMIDLSLREYRENILRRGLKSAGHLIVDSHLLAVPARPVSSMFRLLTWGKESAYELVNPYSLALIETRDPPPVADRAGMDLEKWENDLDQITGHPARTGRLKTLIGGEEFFPALTKSLLNARESIDVRMFIFDNDDVAVRIADILKMKSKEDGVRVRVLLDGLGTILGEAALPETLPAGYVPPASIVEYLREDSEIKVRVRPNTFFKADHVKTIVVDGTTGFTGGMNIGREYRHEWHDMMMEVQGPVLKDFQREFEKAWAHVGPFGDLAYFFERLKPRTALNEQTGYPVRILYTQANDPQIFRAMIEAARRAKSHIYISNPYISDDSFLYELIRARRRGVDVRVIMPVHGNHGVMNLNNVSQANTLFRNGIRVYFYPGMSHAKAAIFDGWMTAGSANLDKLSLKDNLEMNLATSYPEPVQELKERLFENDFSMSGEMTEPLPSDITHFLATFLADQL